MTDNLFTLAQRAAKALTAYEKGVAKKKAGHNETITAVIEYGTALLEGREAHASDKAFGRWVEDNGLDQTKPFERGQERSEAMRIAKIVTLRSTPEGSIFECANSRPNDIMKWVRKQPWYEKTDRTPKIERPLKRARVGRPRKDEPKPVPRISALTGPVRHLTQYEVDPEFVGTPMDWVDKYGHVQVMTAEQYATARFTAWALHMRTLAKNGKQLPELPKVDHNWLRSPKDLDVRKLTEALEYLRPLMAEAEALLERAKGVQDLRQRVSESLQTL